MSIRSRAAICAIRRPYAPLIDDEQLAAGRDGRADRGLNGESAAALHQHRGQRRLPPARSASLRRISLTMLL